MLIPIINPNIATDNFSTNFAAKRRKTPAINE
jgi:hypothetical protein